MDGNATENQELAELKGKIIEIPKVDSSLTKEGEAADAKVTGDEIADLKRRIGELEAK